MAQCSQRKSNAEFKSAGVTQWRNARKEKVMRNTKHPMSRNGAMHAKKN
jgi:hypothetical protein